MVRPTQIDPAVGVFVVQAGRETEFSAGQVPSLDPAEVDELNPHLCHGFVILE